MGSVLLLSVFYFTDYQLAGFIPKPAFSSLLVLAFIDMMSNWFVKSYFKTEEKLEWLVVPLIVVLAFVVGLLQAVLLGFAMSMFLFVASFCTCSMECSSFTGLRCWNMKLTSRSFSKDRSGVVKYVSNGVNVRSTIERSPKVSRWLDKSAVQIQILVMQNFLFFGNASSLNSYITTMFAEPDDSVDPIFVTPCPKFLVVDLTLVTGMDTSAVDAFSDILAVCSNNNCKLFLSGVSPRLQKVMSLCGVKPDNNIDRSQRRLRFFPGLDAAIGKAEDMLIECESFEEENTYPVDAASGDGFLRALYHIDEQHETTFANDLSDLQTYTTAIDVAPGNALYEDHNLERALFFIEHGVMVSCGASRLVPFKLTKHSLTSLSPLSRKSRGARTLHCHAPEARLSADVRRMLALSSQVAFIRSMGPNFELHEVRICAAPCVMFYVDSGRTLTVLRCIQLALAG